MAENQPKPDDKCEHGNEPASCVECNPIFKDEQRRESMTTSNSAGVEYPARFHSVTVTGVGREVSTVTELFPTTATDPRLLGEPPVRDIDDTCTFCGDPWVGPKGEHWDDYIKEYVSARDFHRFGMADRVEGFFSDELTAGAR